MIYQFEPVLLEEWRRNNDVTHPCLVFETQEHKSFCRARPLANNHPAGYAYKSAITQLTDIDRCQRFELVQLASIISNRVLSDRESRPTKIRIHSLQQLHLLQW